jgi:hypothetical protein
VVADLWLVATIPVEELGAAALDLDTVIIMLVLHRVTGFAIALNCGNASMTIRLGFGKPSDGLASQVGLLCGYHRLAER